MNLLLLLSVLFSSSLTLAFAEDEHPLMNCVPTSCGNVTNITYPFWVHNQQPSQCGFPAFKLICKNQILVLEIPPSSYQVKKIFYENRSVLLVNEDLINSKCPVQSYNLSFTLTPFNLSSVNKELTFISCPSGYELNFYKIQCSKGNTFAHLGSHLGLNSSCEFAAMPVLDYLRFNVSDYAKILENGFLVEWTVADCSECRESKGQCGYSYKNSNFMCICHDRAHWKSCIADEIQPAGNGNKKGMAILIGGVSTGGVFVSCLIVFFLYKRSKRQHKIQSTDLHTCNISPKISSKKDHEFGDDNYHTHIFSYHELEEATNCFDSSRELGDGGYGTVYRGELQDGRTVAVKRLYESNYRRLEQFMNEVEILSQLRHKNLVALYGCTSRHSRELLLVYEFVPNGTLADHLHGSFSSNGPHLPWIVRMSIAIQTADALSYLHSVEPQIIHRDVKTNNILLDNNFHVKVADFGLSRLFPLDATHVSTAPQGTPGYVDPEYYQCYQLTEKSDVYSFGVVLVELISSKPAVDISRHRHEINLSNLAITKIQNNQIDQLVDFTLGYEKDLEITGMINQVAELAFRCLQPDREMRPTIKEASDVLRQIQSGADEKDKEVDLNEVAEVEESRLLKNVSMLSPDSVTKVWSSRSTLSDGSV